MRLDHGASRHDMAAERGKSGMMDFTASFSNHQTGRISGCVPTNYNDGWYIGCNAEATWNYSIGQIKAQSAWNAG